MDPHHYATHAGPQHPLYRHRGSAAQFATVGRTASMLSGATMMVPLNAWSPPSAQEHQFFDVLFAAADEEKRNFIGGLIAVAFFSRSGVDKSLLREIWTIADSQQRSELSRNEFYVAMRLISMAQRGEAISPQRFHELASVPFPLPSFGGIPLPHAVPSISQIAHGAPVAQHDKSYAVTEEEKQRYDGIFKQYDTDHDGFLHGGEAVQLFGMSGLDRGVLRDIWALADRGQDSRLDTREFYIAMHLIVCVSKRGLPLPAELPSELAESVFGGRGSYTSTPTVPVGGEHSRTNSVSTIAPTTIQLPVLASPSPPTQITNHDSMDAFDSISVMEPSLSEYTRVASFGRASSTSTTQAEGGLGLASRLSTISLPINTAVELTLTSVHPASSGVGNPAPSTSFFGGNSTGISTQVSGGLGEPRRDRVGSTSSVTSFASVSTDASTTYSASNMHAAPSQSSGFVPMGSSHLHAPSISTTQFVPSNAPQKPFLSDETDSAAVSQLDKSNEALLQVVQSIEKKQDAIHTLLGQLRELDQLRHELLALSTKRDTIRVATNTSNLEEKNTDTHAVRAVEQTLRELIEGERTTIHKLRAEVSRLEVQLTEGTGISSSFSGDVGEPVPMHPTVSMTPTSDPPPLTASPLESTPKNDFEAFGGFGSSSPAPEPKGFASQDAFAKFNFS